MNLAPAYCLPPDKRQNLRKARSLTWISMAFLLSIIGVLLLLRGDSQIMQVAWLDDLLGLIPSISFLLASRTCEKAPDPEFPYGHTRAVSIAFLCAALTLTLMGGYLLYESAALLASRTHPTIGSIEMFGHTVWMGWPMMAALVYSGIPPAILGRKILPLAKTLHNKALYGDAMMKKADWMSALAGVAGVAGIGFGIWWADAATAIVISLDILKDGLVNLKNAVLDLMDRRPMDVENRHEDPIGQDLQQRVAALDWVEDAAVRLREQGDMMTGAVYVTPGTETDLLARLDEARRLVNALHWRLYDVEVIPVRRLREPPSDERETASGQA